MPYKALKGLIRPLSPNAANRMASKRPLKGLAKAFERPSEVFKMVFRRLCEGLGEAFDRHFEGLEKVFCRPLTAFKRLIEGL